MNVMYSLTLRQMIKNRRRTLITILGVIVSVAMIAAVSSFFGSFMGLFQRVEVQAGGDWHVMFEQVNEAALAQIRADDAVEAVSLYSEIGSSNLPEKLGRFESLTIGALDSDGFARMQVNLTEGRYPVSTGECVLSSAFAGKAGYRVGDLLSVPLHGETGEVIGGASYTIVGLAEMDVFEKSWNNFGCAFTLEDGSMAGNNPVAYVTLKHPDAQLYKWAQRAAEDHELVRSFHNSLLMYMGLSGDFYLLITFWMVAGIVLAIIMVGSVALIYNAFAISVTDRSAQFGMLSSVGATARQKRASVLFEAVVIALISIPPGIFFGLVGIGITFKIVSNMLTSTFGMAAELTLVVLPSALVISAVTSMATILVSAWMPARRAGRMSPMEAIRMTRDIKLSPRAVKTSWLTRKLFGFEGELAIKNLKRNRKRYRITVFSLIVSLVLFLSAYGFTHYMTGAYDMAEQPINCDLVVNISSNTETSVDYGAHFDLANRAQAIALNSSRVTSPMLSDLYCAASDLKLTPAAAQLPTGDGGEIRFQLVALDDAHLSEFAGRIGADAAALRDADHPAAIIVNDITCRQGNVFTTLSMLEPSALRLAVLQYDNPATLIDLDVAGMTGESVEGMSPYYYGPTVVAIVSEATLTRLAPVGGANTQILAYTDDSAEMAEQLDQLSYGGDLDLSVYDVTGAAKASQQTMLIINIFVYGFIALLSLIGIANIVGTISTGFMLRKREFAMLKSVGITQSAFNRMIYFESLFYGLKTVMYGLPAGIGAMYLIWWALSRNFAAPFSVPWQPLVWGVIGVFAVVALTMAYSSGRIRRDNIIDGLRGEA